jgi:transcription elongation factor GreA
MEKILLTRTGYEKLLHELDLLSQVERPQIVRELQEAAYGGRLEKNPDYQSALAQRQKVDRRIRHIRQILANAEVLVGSNVRPTKVGFNCRVRVRNLATGQEKEFKIVSPVEADASRGHISKSSPLGRSLLGRGPEERVTVKTPSGLRTYQILEIAMEEP